MKKFFSLNLYICLFLTCFANFAFGQVPTLSSLPGSSAVIYLDFDGHSDNSGWWDDIGFVSPIVTAASTLTTTQMTEVFNRVAEDYRPFNVNITTTLSVYNAALTANRQRVVITSNSEFYTSSNGGAGGVAYLNTFGGGEIACYVFPNFLGNSAKNVAEACSHEAGHTLGLNHHSQFNSSCNYVQQYHPGKGTGQTKWAPIMGNSYSSIISQWYNGSTNGTTCSSSVQNDVAVITTNNGFTYRADDFGNSIAAAATLNFAGTNITQKGIITTQGDVDAFKIVIPTAGVYSLFAAPTSLSSTTYSGANLDVRMWITTSAGSIISTSNDTTRLDATLPAVSLAAGTYYILIDGVGVSNYLDFGGIGPNDNGSLGEYTLTVNRLCTPVVTSTTAGSRCGPGTVTLSATASSNTINWYASSTSTTVLGTGVSFTTPSLSQTTTYFVGVTASGCATPSTREAVAANINSFPTVNAGSDRSFAQNAGNQTLTGTPAGGTWSGFGVSSAGVFNPNRPAGVYSLTYCVSNTNCTKCDTMNATVTAQSGQVATPVITPATGSYLGGQTVVISCATPGASIYYTTSGNTPVIGVGHTKLYVGSFFISATTTVKAIAVASGLSNSGQATNTISITIPEVVATPVITPAAGTYLGPRTVTITCPTPGATIHFTSTGNTPGTTLNTITKLYTGPFTITGNVTIKAIGLKTGMSVSATATNVFTINTQNTTVATPVITPATGTYLGPQTVSISCATVGSSIYYTTSGNNPVIGTSFTRLYTGPFLVTGFTTVRAMGTATGQLNSAVSTSFITISAGGPVANNPAEDAGSELVQFGNAESIFAYPNPSEGRFNIQFESSDSREITVFNSKGILVQNPQISSEGNVTTINLEGQPQGLYLIYIVKGNRVENLKIFKK